LNVRAFLPIAALLGEATRGALSAARG